MPEAKIKLSLKLAVVVFLGMLFLWGVEELKAESVSDSLTISCNSSGLSAVLNWQPYAGGTTNSVQRGHSSLTAEEINSLQCGNYWCFLPNSQSSYSYTDNSLQPNINYEYRVKITAEDYTNSVFCDTTEPIGSIPTSITGEAEAIGESVAILKGAVNPNGAATEAWFEYGSSVSFDKTTGKIVMGSGNEQESLSAPLSGLSSATKYYFRTVASNSFGTTRGAVKSFITKTAAAVPIAPSARTLSADGISTGSATLNASVNPNGANTRVWFEFGTNFSNLTALEGADIGSGNSSVNLEDARSGLSPDTTYYFRIAALNSVGESKGSVLSFKTEKTVETPPPPAPTSTPSGYSATLTIKPTSNSLMVGNAITFKAYYDSDGKGPISAVDVSSEAMWGASNNFISSEGGGRFRGRSIGKSVAEASYMLLSAKANVSVVAFEGAPFVKTDAVSDLTPTSFVMNGRVNPNGKSTKVWFEYGKTEALGSKTASKNLAASYANTDYNFSVVNLVSGDAYYYRIVAENSLGLKKGAILNTNLTEGSRLTIEPEHLAAKVGEEISFNAYYDADGPSGDGDRVSVADSVLWVPSDGKIASHQGNGKFRLESAGNADIVAYYNPGGEVKNINDLENFVASSSLFSVEEAGENGEYLSTGEAVHIGTSGATLEGEVVGGKSVKAWFEFGPTDQLGESTEPEYFESTGTVPVSAEIGGLWPDTAYYYRIVRSSGFSDVRYGEVKSFSTKSEMTKLFLMIGGLIAVVLAVCAAGYMGYKYWKEKREENDEAVEPTADLKTEESGEAESNG